MSLRYHDPHIKSLLHFNYPYYGETSTGLHDEIGLFTWSEWGPGDKYLMGTESPSEAYASYAPLFGYRCLALEHIDEQIRTDLSSPLALEQMEISFWLYRPYREHTTNALILQMFRNVPNLSSVTEFVRVSFTNGEISFRYRSSSDTIPISAIAKEQVPFDKWTYLRIQFSPEQVNISLNNSAGTTVKASEIIALPNIARITLGELDSTRLIFDEFQLRDNFTTGLPSEPEQGRININSVGGFGTAVLGDVTLSSDGVFAASCTVEPFQSSATDIFAANVIEGKFGAFKAGDEIMLKDKNTGQYSFRTILKISGTTYTLNGPAGFDSQGAFGYQVPNFKSLTVPQGVTLYPNPDGIGGRGIIAFRCKGNCTINGRLLTTGRGYPRRSPAEEAGNGLVSHSKLPDNFLTSTGGGVFITCGGTLTASSSARIGAPWPGSSKGGSPNAGLNTGGGAGYGGSSTKSAGMVGYGGGNSDATDSNKGFGAPPGRNAAIVLSERNSSTLSDSASRPSSGACIMIFAGTLKADADALSTGGENAPANTSPEVQGAGTGFCYLACKNLG